MKKLAIVLLPILLLSALLVTTACSSDDSDSVATPAATQAKYPLTVVDMLGRSVQINQLPTHIVTTHPTATEMLYEVGGTAVGRDSGSKYPPEVTTLPTVGMIYTISVESVAALNPDLIIIEALTQQRIIDSLQTLGVPVIAVRAASVDDINQSLALVGNIIDREEAAAQAVADINSKIASVQGNSTGNQSVLILIADADRSVYAAKPDSYPGTIAALLNLNNLAAGLSETGGKYPGFAMFTAEQALGSDPDVVFAITPSPMGPRLSTQLAQFPGFNEMDPVKDGRVVELDAALFMQDAGPRIADAMEEMLRQVNEVAP